MKPVAALVGRDIRVSVRAGGSAPAGVLFFLVLVSIMPFSVGPDLALLARIGPGILWMGALLSTLLGLERLLAADHEDGSLDLILMSSVPLELTMLAKAAAHWITSVLPLIVAAPLLGMFLNIDPRALGTLVLTLLAGTPALTLTGLVGAAVAVVMRRGGLLLPILVLPLTIPVLIFGVAASSQGHAEAAFGAPFMILVALTLASLAVGPVAAAALLRHGLD